MSVLPVLTMMIGLPASGKSTLYNRYYADEFCYSTDNELELIAKSQGKTYSDVFQDSFKDALASANKKLEVATAAGDNVVWDQTNVARGKRETVLKFHMFMDYMKFGLCFLPPSNKEEFEILMDRVNSRVGKNIPRSVVVNMLSNYQMPVIQEGFDDIIFYNSFVGGPDCLEIVTNVDKIFEHFAFTKYANQKEPV